MDREEQYEYFLGIRTSEKELPCPQNYSMPGAYAVYEASEYEGLIQIFDTLTLQPQDTLVDFGCGLGRVLFYCNHKFRCGVTGVEYDHDIYERLLDNAEYYHVRFQGQRRRFSLLHMKAEEYKIEPSDNYFYFFNPFSGEILEEILGHIVESVEMHPRRATVIFYYCTYSMMRAIRKYPFILDHVIKLPAYRDDVDEKAYIYHIGA